MRWSLPRGAVGSRWTRWLVLSLLFGVAAQAIFAALCAVFAPLRLDTSVGEGYFYALLNGSSQTPPKRSSAADAPMGFDVVVALWSELHPAILKRGVETGRGRCDPRVLRGLGTSQINVWLELYDTPVREFRTLIVSGWPLDSFAAQGDPAGPLPWSFEIPRSWGSVALAKVPGQAGTFNVSRIVPLRPLLLGTAVNTLVFSTPVWLLAALLQARRWIRVRDGRCMQCGYSMRESRDQETCSECGFHASAATQRRLRRAGAIASASFRWSVFASLGAVATVAVAWSCATWARFSIDHFLVDSVSDPRLPPPDRWRIARYESLGATYLVATRPAIDARRTFDHAGRVLPLWSGILEPAGIGRAGEVLEPEAPPLNATEIGFGLPFRSMVVRRSDLDPAWRPPPYIALTPDGPFMRALPFEVLPWGFAGDTAIAAICFAAAWRALRRRPRGSHQEPPRAPADSPA